MARHKPSWANSDLFLRSGAWLLVLLGSFANLLNYHDYPLLTPEVLAVGLGLTGIAILFALAHCLAAARLSFLMTGSLIGLAVDLNDEGGWPAVLATTAAGMAAAYLFDRVVLKLLCAAFAGVLVFQLANVPLRETPLQATAFRPVNGSPAGPPPVIHVIFDAYLGMSGMREDEASYAALRRFNEDFFGERGFRLYGGAYSEHRDTANSIPAMLSFDRAPLAVESPEEREPPEPLEYFIRLDRLGYRTHVWKTDFLDLCSGQPIVACTSRPLANLPAVRHTEMPVMDRAKVIATVLLTMTKAPYAVFTKVSELSGVAGSQPDESLRSLTALDTLASLEPMLRSARNGEAFVAHLILPHDPFVLDGDCRLQPRSRWTVAADKSRGRQREAAYGEQMRCALTSLDRLLAALDRSSAGRRAIIIVHGDHGSRLVNRIPRVGATAVTTRDFAMTYATLFAVRAPGLAPGYDSSPAPVSYLLDELSASNFRRMPSSYKGSRHVFLADREWVPRKKVALPPFGLTTN